MVFDENDLLRDNNDDMELFGLFRIQISDPKKSQKSLCGSSESNIFVKIAFPFPYLIKMDFNFDISTTSIDAYAEIYTYT